MSHPPETSQELTDEIYNALAAVREDIDARQAIVALIDAWVRVREARTLDPFMALLDNLRNLKSMAEKCDAEGAGETPQKEWTPYQGKILAYDYCIGHLEYAIEQLKGGTYGQAEAPSAAASANSEPGGA